jgi:hypothetical protein
MRILKQTRHPHPLVVQAHTLLMPLLVLLVLLLLLGVLLSFVEALIPPASSTSSRPELSSS